jgi:hypothetical protein
MTRSLYALVLLARIAAAQTSAQDAAAQTDAAPIAAPRTRHVGMMFGFGPAVIGLDLTVGKFYGFVSGSLLVPVATDGAMGAFALGAGHSFQLPSSRWRFDLFASIAVDWTTYNDYMEPQHTRINAAIGVGAGFHVTLTNGFTAAFMLPFFGLGFGDGILNTGDNLSAYYTSAAASFPLATVGYRF